MTYRVRTTHRADSDIIRNANWWAEHHSRTQADEWHAAIYEQIRSLDQFPESHSLAYENEDYDFEIRESLFGLGSRPSYRILFTVVDNDLIVLAVRAAEQDRLKPGGLPSLPSAMDID